MNNVVSAVWKFAKQNPYSVLMTLFLLWMCIGIFPLRCYETDGQEIILGCDVMYREGWSFPPVYSYEYRMQPLTTLMVVALKHLVPFFTCEQIYCFTTVVFSLVFLFGCISFVQHVTKAPPPTTPPTCSAASTSSTASTPSNTPKPLVSAAASTRS